MPNIVLIGFSHCGKSTFGKALAKKLQRPFIDTDKLLLEGTSFSKARNLYQKLGEDKFRNLETEKIKLLAEQDGLVIATGGGTVLKFENHSLLQKNGQLIYLATPAKILWQRIKKHGIPAYLSANTNPYQAFLQVYAERESIYQALANDIVATQQKTYSQILTELIALARAI